MLHERTSPAALGFVRAGVYLTWFLVLLRHPTQEFARLPRGWFAPFGPARIVPDAAWDFVLQPHVLFGLWLALLGLSLLLAAGIRPFGPLALSFAALLLLNDAVDKGFNVVVNHAQMGLLYSACVLAFFPAADGFSILGARKPRSREVLYSAPLVIVAILISVAYAMLGIRRLVHGGPAMFTGDSILTYFGTQSLRVGQYHFRFGLLPLTIPALAVMARVGFVFVTMAELSTPFTLFFRKLRWAWLALMVPFHTMTLLTMNIFFYENSILALLFFTGLSHWIVRRRGSTAKGPPLPAPAPGG